MPSPDLFRTGFALLLCIAFSGCVTPSIKQEAERPDPLCLQTAAHPPAGTARRWAAIRAGLDEHALFNGHIFNRDGQLEHFGMAESETPSEWEVQVQADSIAWMNVKRYWDTLDQQLVARKKLIGDKRWPDPIPSLAAVRSYQSHPGDTALLQRQDVPLDLANALEHSGVLTAPQRQAFTQSLYRAAINDVPWSASFISYLMTHAGYGLNQFEYSASHIDYMRKAFAVSREERGAQPAQLSDYQYRACNARLTPPRPGDLLCALRAAPENRASFTQLDSMLASDGGHLKYPAHCELITDVDRGQRTLRMVGGNVLQSVALRALKLDADGALDNCYLQQPAQCTGRLETRNWVVLMQHRDDAQDAFIGN